MAVRVVVAVVVVVLIVIVVVIVVVVAAVAVTVIVWQQQCVCVCLGESGAASFELGGEGTLGVQWPGVHLRVGIDLIATVTYGVNPGVKVRGERGCTHYTL